MARDIVLVIGDVIADVIVRPRGATNRGSDTRASIRARPGGSGANQAAWLSRLGTKARFAGRVGASDVEACVAELARFGVDARLGADPELPTGMLVTLVAEDGERSFLTDRGANARLGAADLPDSLLDGVGLVHVSGYALFEPGPRAAVLRLMDRARAAAIPVTVDPSSTAFLREAGAEAFLGWTSGAAICFPNAEEAALLAGGDALDAQLVALARHYPLVVIKRGAEGAAAAASDGTRVRVSAPPIQPVDTTGAGDAFLAGFLAARMRGLELRGCLEAGIEAGGQAARILGGRPPLPGLPESAASPTLRPR